MQTNHDKVWLRFEIYLCRPQCRNWLIIKSEFSTNLWQKIYPLHLSILVILVCSVFFACISSKWAVWRLRERKEKEPPSASQLIISWSACPHSPHNPIFQTLDLCISYSHILVFRDVVICISGPQSPYSTQFFKLKVFIFILITPLPHPPLAKNNSKVDSQMR